MNKPCLVEYLVVPEIFIGCIKFHSPKTMWYEEKLKEIYSEIDKLEKTRFEATIIKQKADVFYKFISISLALMLIAFALKNLLFKSIFS